MRSEGYGSCRVCLSVSLLGHISPLGLLFVLKTRLRTHRATKVKIFVAFSLKLCRSRATALPALYGYNAVGHFLSAEYARALLKCHVDRGAEFGQYKTSSSSFCKFCSFHASNVQDVMLIYPRLSSAFLAHHSAY